MLCILKTQKIKKDLGYSLENAVHFICLLYRGGLNQVLFQTLMVFLTDAYIYKYHLYIQKQILSLFQTSPRSLKIITFLIDAFIYLLQ